MDCNVASTLEPAIGVALMGYGYAGRTIHGPLITACKGLALRAVYSSQPAKVCADYPAMTVASTLEAIWNDPLIQVVVIATPNETHANLASQALLAGKHVVIDKPFAVCEQEGMALIELAHAKQKLLSVFHNRRWDADFLTVRSVIASKKLGEIKYCEIHFDRYRPQVNQRWRESDAPGAGLWYDLGSHLVDQAIQLFGLPQSVFGDFAKQREGAEGVDYFHVILKYANKRVILHGSNLVVAESPRFILHGTQGSYIKYGLDPQEGMLLRGKGPSDPDWGLDMNEGTLFTRIEGIVQQVKWINRRGDYGQYYKLLHRAILGLGPIPVPAEEALQVIRVLEVALR